MSRSLSYLRRGLLGIAFVGSLGFGASQAFADSKAGPATAMLSCSIGETLCCSTCMRHVKRCPC